ncbi:MAG TPA: hypothetical protein VGR52_08270 [Stellaceae bacterium]|nr:hypothetical protein [Stellaceae bacterium]
MRDGHIAAVELLSDASDAAAIAQALVLFKERQDKYASFEIWDRARFVYRFPADDDTTSGDKPKPAA